MTMTSADNFRRTLALFGLACLAAGVMAPFFAWFAFSQGSAAPSLRPDSYAPGETIGDLLYAGDEVWTAGDVRRDEIVCTSTERRGETQTQEPYDLGPDRDEHATISVDGQSWRFVTTARADFLRLSCRGGGTTTFRYSKAGMDTTAMGWGALVATPVLLAVGIVIRRSGARLTGSDGAL